MCTLDGYRITEIPRPADSVQQTGDVAAAGTDRDSGRTQRTAALVAAYHATAAGRSADDSCAGVVAFAWLRAGEGEPVQLLTAGAALAGGGTGRASAAGTTVLALPGGARATVLAPGTLAGIVSLLPCWQPIGGLSDGLLVEGPDPPRGERLAASLEECLLPAWTGPFGWLVVAEPVSPAEVRQLADAVAHRQRLADGMTDRFPDREVAARRLRHRHGELRQAGSTGLWRVSLLAGGTDRGAAARIAGLVVASVDLQGLPYALAPLAGVPAGAAGVLRHPAASPDPAAQQPDAAEGSLSFPFHASTELLAALVRPPRVEVPGVRLVLRPEFDVTQETVGTSGAMADDAPAVDHGPQSARSVAVGTVLDRNRRAAGALRFPLASLNRHMFVCGATGGGKSQTVRAVLEAATGAGVPWLVVEPAKAEYRLMAARLGAEVVRIRPGEADAIAAGLNPLEPARDETGRRFPLQTHADLVRALFLASFQPDDPFPQVLGAALTRVYEEAGWDLALGEPATDGVAARYPGLTDLQRTAEQVVGDIGYGEEVEGNVLGYMRVRLSSLRLGTTGRFVEGGHAIDVGALLRRNVVLEVEDVGDDRDKAFLMGAVLIRLAEHLRLTRDMPAYRPRQAGQGQVTLRHLTVFEEAHRLLRRPDRSEGPAAHAIELFASLLAEVRAYGEGLVIAEQIPSRLVPDVIKNTAVKITHRLPAADDREAVGATMNMTAAQSRYLVTLAPGEAAVFTDGMDYPLLAVMPDGTARESATAATVGPGEIVRCRSATCGPDCARRPCTLRDMRVALRTLDRWPGITLWAELSVVAHLTGCLVPDVR